MMDNNDTKAINWMKSELSNRFEMKDLGEAELCLGLEIARSSLLLKLWLIQTKYASSILKQFGMENCHPVHTPIDDYRTLQKRYPERADKSRSRNKLPYRE